MPVFAFLLNSILVYRYIFSNLQIHIHCWVNIGLPLSILPFLNNWDSQVRHVLVFLKLFCAVIFFFFFRLRRIDVVASVLWFVVTCLHWSESYLKMDVPDWLDTVKFGTTCLCCLVGFAAAVATRKSIGQRRARGRRSESEQWHFFFFLRISRVQCRARCKSAFYLVLSLSLGNYSLPCHSSVILLLMCYKLTH